MRLKTSFLTFILLIGIILSGSPLTTNAISNDLPPLNQAITPWQSKIDPWILETAQQGETEFLVFLNEQADLSPTTNLQTKEEKGWFVYQQLTETAQRSQRALLAILKRQGVSFRTYWIANMVWVRGSLPTIQMIAQRNDIAHLYANPSVKLDLPLSSQAIPNLPANLESVEWNIQQVHAPDVWSAGYTGQGAVVAGQDTGYDWDHEALINQYRGWNGSTANHDYNWHDSIHFNNPNTPTGNPCGFDSAVPCDDYGHGTHTMGTMVGDNGSSRKIGVAPGARWIGCRNMEQGWGTPATYAECYQWFIAPTRIDGTDPRPDLAPDVINNSWACPSAEGCTVPNILLTVVNNVRTAGIVTAHSAGNSGPSCNTVNTPAAIYEASFTVGATGGSDTIASFSSRGPVAIDGSFRMKPNVSAPGVSVISSTPNNKYTSMSGTSMAAPHVAGLVALLISANPDLRGQVDALEDLIEQTAIPLTTTESCGGVPGTQIPNNTYGWGRIDALAAFRGHLLYLNKIPSLFYLPYGQELGYTITLNHIATISATTQIVVTDTLPVGTNLIAATPPYSLVGDTIHWLLPELLPLENTNITFTVQTPLSGITTLENRYYGAKSDQVTLPVTGPPITTTIGFIYFLPYLFSIGP